MSHEKTITVEIDGGYYNVPTVRGGKQLKDSDAVDAAVREKRLGQRFDSMDAAVSAARQRSADAGLELQRGRR